MTGGYTCSSPIPSTYPIVKRIFAEYLAGRGIKAIASTLTTEGIPCPSASDPARNKHRSLTWNAWSYGAVRAILKNPRYTGYQVWARQRKDEVLLDIDDVAAGHVTKLRWNDEDQWQWSNEPAHEALISTDDWQAVQAVFTAGTRTSAPTRTRSHDYMLKGMITCSGCGRKLIANTVRGKLQYRCRLKKGRRQHRSPAVALHQRGSTPPHDRRMAVPAFRRRPHRRNRKHLGRRRHREP